MNIEQQSNGWYWFKIDFETIKGKVYIAGITTHPDQLEELIELSKTIKGVTEIINYVIVKK